MAGIFARVTQGRWLDLWYHFAIMFEALFILTTIDAGTRVGRYLLQDLLGNLWKPLGETRSTGANVLASVLLVSGWGYFLIQGRARSAGGRQFAVAAVRHRQPDAGGDRSVSGHDDHPEDDAASRGRGARGEGPKAGKPALALVTLVPLVWLLAVTMTAGVQKILHTDPRIGFLAQARVLDTELPVLEQARGCGKGRRERPEPSSRPSRRCARTGSCASTTAWTRLSRRRFWCWSLRLCC